MEELNQNGRIGTGLIWGPVYQPLQAHVLSGDRLLLLISPFIGLDALKRFLQCAEVNSDIKVVARWRPEDLLSGVSDIAVYPYLQERRIPLYINHDIHLKLYIFASNNAFSTSGNLTLRGFGYSERSNIEVGGFVQLTQEDWSRIYALIKNSKQVDEDMYQRCKRYIDSCPKVIRPATPPPDLYGTSKLYTLSTLPAMETPAKLAEFYFNSIRAGYSAEEIRRATHDIVTFAIPPGLSNTELDNQLSDSFRRTLFVVEFVELLKTEKSLRFGAVNDWIYRMCEDVPLPYRWDIKENTRIFYNWLAHYFTEIVWDRPNHSQVIYWRESSG